jgi:sortase (surface protein transpeptidase)
MNKILEMTLIYFLTLITCAKVERERERSLAAADEISEREREREWKG